MRPGSSRNRTRRRTAATTRQAANTTERLPARRARPVGLTQKILLFTSLLVVSLVVTSLAFTTVQADRLAHENIDRALSETKGVWETFQADRYNKLKLGVRVLANDPYFKAAVETD